MHSCKKPCNECPFRKDSLRGWLADYTPKELHHIVMNELPFPCHMTHQENVGWEEVEDGEYPLCAGALRYMKKNAKRPRNEELGEMVNSLTLKDCEDILGMREFFNHHSPLETI